MHLGMEYPVIESGTVIDQYTIIRRLACGGMSEVYLALDMWLDRNVALKIIYPEILAIKRLKEQFWTEVKTIAKFNHPHVITIYGVGEYQGRQYAALEFAEGRTLRDLLDQRLTVEECIQYGLSIAEALKALHGSQIVHGDLKPENIMIPPNGILRVVDFGLATSFHDHLVKDSWKTGPSLSSDKRSIADIKTVDDSEGEGISGTPLYMAPEQWRRESLSGATDMWAFGMIMYEMLSGAAPYDESEMCVSALGAMVCTNLPMPNLSSSYLEMPPALRVLVDRCLLKDRKKRPSAGEAVRTLRAIPSIKRARASNRDQSFVMSHA